MDPGSLRVRCDVPPAAAEVGFYVVPENLEQHRSTQLGDRLAAPVLAEFLQVAVALIGGMDQFVAPCRGVANAQADVAGTEAAKRSTLPPIEGFDGNVPGMRSWAIKINPADRRAARPRASGCRDSRW
jgi:hypothetical protein